MVSEHFDAVKIANSLGIAIDAFTMIYPWEDEQDLQQTTEHKKNNETNKKKRTKAKSRPKIKHEDSTIMTPYQGTRFLDMIRLGELPGVVIDEQIDPGNLYYKGALGGSGWPYVSTKLSRERYVAEQTYRHSFRPDYR